MTSLVPPPQFPALARQICLATARESSHARAYQGKQASPAHLPPARMPCWAELVPPCHVGIQWASLGAVAVITPRVHLKFDSDSPGSICLVIVGRPDVQHVGHSPEQCGDLSGLMCRPVLSDSYRIVSGHVCDLELWRCSRSNGWCPVKGEDEVLDACTDGCHANETCLGRRYTR